MARRTAVVAVAERFLVITQDVHSACMLELAVCLHLSFLPPRKQRGSNVFGRICLSVCLSVSLYVCQFVIL